MKSIGIDLGGTRIKLALMEEGRILRNHIVPVKKEIGVSGNLKEIKDLIMPWVIEHKEDIKGIGIAFPGLVDPKKKAVISVNAKYTDAVGFDFVAWGKEQFDLPIVMDNDANAALLGELAYGCGTGFTDAVIVILGTGVGTAVVMNGQLLRGKHFQAGCLGGHFTISEKERLCTCGNFGCVEANASTYTLPSLAKEYLDFLSSGLSKEEVIDFMALKKWVENKDKVALELMDRINYSISSCVVNMIHAYDPELVILSGGVMGCGDLMLQPITKQVNQRAWTPWGKVQIRLANNPEQSVLYGLHKLVEDILKMEDKHDIPREQQL